MSPSGPIHASWPNFRPIGSELSEKIEQKKKIKKSRRVNHIRSAAATLRSAVAGGVNKVGHARQLNSYTETRSFDKFRVKICSAIWAVINPNSRTQKSKKKYQKECTFQFHVCASARKENPASVVRPRGGFGGRGGGSNPHLSQGSLL